MTPHGQKQVGAARADERWDAAYAPTRAMTHETVPADFRAAVERVARAQRTFAALDRANLFALTFRINKLQTAAGRQRTIERFVELLARGETLVPAHGSGQMEDP